MQLDIESRCIGEVVILDLHGKITLGESTSLLREEILIQVVQGQTKIVVNLAGVNYVDSAGLGELVAASTTVQQYGGILRLLHLGSKMQDLLQVTKLHTVFAIFDNEQAALASFGS
jgi:anti-sigma B factor antagonist